MIDEKAPLPVSAPAIEKRISLSDNDAPAAPGIRKKLLKLEAIRGFAAFYLVLHHTLPKEVYLFGIEFTPFRYAQEAVILFFILSGFVIHYAYATSSDKSFRSFFLKRLVRIHIPLLFVFLANCIAVYPAQFSEAEYSWQSFFGNLLMLQQVSEMWRSPVPIRPFLGNLPLWSLTFEWWFYMIFFFAFTRWGARASRIVYATSIVAAFTYLVYPFALNRELMYLSIWWAGADVAKLYLNKEDISIKNLLPAFVTLSIITVIVIANVPLYTYFHPGTELMMVMTPLVEIRHFGFSLVALVAAIYWRRWNWVGFRYTFGLFEPLAVISFSLYISHWFLVSHATYLHPYIENIYLRSLVYFIGCCLFCILVERVLYPRISKAILTAFSVKKKPFVAVN